MDTRYLQTLIAIVETGSFSQAAKKLHITQSAVSQRIRYLEDAFAYELFDRSGGSFELTEAGGIVMEHARQILSIENGMLDKLKRIKLRNKIAMCCTPTFGTVYLPGVLNRFMLANGAPADFKFILHSPDQALDGIIRKDYDVAIVEHCEGTDLEKFQAYPLPDDELLFVSAPALPLAVPELDLEELFSFCLFARKEGCSSRRLLTSGLQKFGKNLDDFSGVVTSDDLRLTCQTVLAGGGISFMSKSLVCEYLASGQMAGHYVRNFPHTRKRTVVMLKGREDEPLLQSFVRCIFNAMDVASPF